MLALDSPQKKSAVCFGKNNFLPILKENHRYTVVNNLDFETNTIQHTFWDRQKSFNMTIWEVKGITFIYH